MRRIIASGVDLRHLWREAIVINIGTDTGYGNWVPTINEALEHLEYKSCELITATHHMVLSPNVICDGDGVDP